MNGSVVIQGRRIGPVELDLIRGLLTERRDWHRTQVSRELCRAWGWRNAAGQPKDMACRTLLLRLEARGWIRLPPRQRASVNGARHRGVPRVEPASEGIEDRLRQLLPLDIRVVAPASEDGSLWRSLIGHYHYLGLRSAAGERLQYLIRDARGRVLCAMGFAAAAWRCRARDRFIGWDDRTRARNLPWLASNTRFLILPWVRVPHLASHVLGRVARRVSSDWQTKYGHGLWALETFVDPSRFTGACYRAANWSKVGQTTGRTRNDGTHRGSLTSVKDVYLYSLASNFRRALCSAPVGIPVEAGSP